MKEPHVPLPPEVQAAIARGNKIEAIRLLREATGLSLASAKEAVEHAGLPSLQRSAGGTHALPPQVLAELARGNKIEAIKLLREATGVGLKEAKDTVDAAESSGANSAGTVPGLAPGEVPRTHGKAWGRWLLLTVVLVGVLAFLKLR